MHGRLKVKTTEQQRAEKAKERAIKAQKYLAGMNLALQMRKKPLDSENQSDEITSKLLSANPDVQSLWNQRREYVLEKKRSLDSDEDLLEVLKKDLKLTETCLYENPKSYGAWHHRAWVLCQYPSPPWKEEMDLCNQYLSIDGRNFHCWDHRRFVVKESKMSLMKELDYSLDLIKSNFSNYSAWHYRSQLLPCLNPPSADSPLPIEDSVFLQELKRVVTAVFTDPSDQSPWFFLRWLICIQHLPRVLQLGVIDYQGTKLLIATFTSPVSHSSLHDIEMSIDGLAFSSSWEHMNTQHTVWKCVITKSGSILEVKGPAFVEEFNLDCSTEPKWIFKSSFKSHQLLPLNVQKAFQDLVQDCTLLNEIDQDNKWVLLTLVDLMTSIDCCENYEQIEIYLRKLQIIDPLRSKYYEDKRSSTKLSKELHSCITNNERKLIIPLSELTLIDKPQYLVFMKDIDVSNNSLTSIDWTKTLLVCSRLSVENNNIPDELATSLESISLNKCPSKLPE